MANQAAAGLAVLEVRERINAQADQQAALARAAKALNARLDLRSVLDTLCREADRALGADLAGVYLGDARNGGVGVAAHGLDEDSDWFGYVIRPGEGVGGQVLVTGEPAISNHYQREVELPEAKDLDGIEAAAAVPVRWNGQLKGALSVAFHSMRRVTRQDIETLQAIADLAAVACSNAEAFEQAQTAARTDSLTGFLNHGAVQVRLREEIWRSRRAGGALSCLLVDLDNFKPINDRHGHLIGDEILQRLATAIAAEFRPYDGIARFGGDEFVLVLPDADEQAARVAAERLRELVEETGRTFGEMGVPITASVGIAQWREPLTAAELLDRADRALLLAKQRGKDGVAVASTETEQELAQLDRQAGTTPSGLTSGLWDMISQCDGPGEVVRTLPSFLRRALDLEEVALYEPSDTGAERLPAPRHDRARSRRPGSERVPTRPARDRPGPAAAARDRPDLARFALGADRRAGGHARRRPGARAGGLLCGPGAGPRRPAVRRAPAALQPSRVPAAGAANGGAGGQPGRDGAGRPVGQRLARRRGRARGGDRRARQLHPHPLRAGRRARHGGGAAARPVPDGGRGGPQRGDAARRGQGRHPERDPLQARPPDRVGVGGHARAPGDRRAHPAAHARAPADRPARAARTRALGWRRVPGRARGGGDPDRQPDRLRLRRLQRHDHGAPVPRADVPRRRRSTSCAAEPAASSTRRSSRRC